MPRTAMEDAFIAAGYGRAIASSEIYVVASDMLRAAGMDHATATNRLMNRVLEDRHLLRALVQNFVSMVSADMAGRQPNDGGGKSHSISAHPVNACSPPPSPQAVASGSHKGVEAQSIGAPDRDGPNCQPEGHELADARVFGADRAGKPLADRDERPSPTDAHRPCAPRGPQPRPPAKPLTPFQRSANVAVSRLLNNALDSIRIRDGRKLGDVYFRELPSLISENTREAKLLDHIRKHVANPPPTARVRDLVKASVLDKWIDDINMEVRNGA